MRLAILLVALLPALAFGQGRAPSKGGSGGAACTLDGYTPVFATYFRATGTSGTGYQVDAALACGVDLGPGARNCLGTNSPAEILLGPNDGSTSTIVRVSGQIFATSTVTTNGALDLYNAGFVTNSIGGAVVVDDASGFRVRCKTALTDTCSSAIESTQLDICGIGGALTKRCVCLGDGTTYAWRNLFNLSAGAGTSTTCPAT